MQVHVNVMSFLLAVLSIQWHNSWWLFSVTKMIILAMPSIHKSHSRMTFHWKIIVGLINIILVKALWWRPSDFWLKVRVNLAVISLESKSHWWSPWFLAYMPSMAQSVERWDAIKSGWPGSIPAKVMGLTTDVLLKRVHTLDDLHGVERSVLHRHMIESNKTGW